MDDARLDLLARLPWLRRAFRSRLWQPATMLVTLGFFVSAILTGLLGTPAGSRNFGIVFVWIVWWALLILMLIPLGGRLWCAMCPIPAPGEWLQRRGIVQRTPGRLRTLGLQWPRRLRNIWLQNAGFLLVALFSAIILTRPSITAWVLLGFVLLSSALSLLYENRIFCRYVCPVGGFIGLYSLIAPVELRVKERAICRAHGSKDCVVGTAGSYGCPWLLYPGGMRRNAACNLCAECVRGCPKDNFALNLRPPGSDLLVGAERRLDEAYKSLIMLACALIYPVVLLGPWGWLKDLANMQTLAGWVVYAFGFLVINLLLLPGLLWLTVSAARRLGGMSASRSTLFVDYAYAVAPLGLAGWMAFSLSFLFVNGSYALAVLSDPFGWGWDMLGTAQVPWRPQMSAWAPILQVLTLLPGLLLSIVVAYRISRQHSPAAPSQRVWWGTLPVAVFQTTVTLVFVWLYLG